MNVVIFSGGRGSGVLSSRLIRHPDVRLTLAINGYDDGASTGEVRYFLGDCLGPSDFRKNASQLAHVLGSCAPAQIELLDLRLPVDVSRDDALAALTTIGSEPPDIQQAPSDIARRIADLARGLTREIRGALRARVDAFLRELAASGRPFNFSDCALGNIVFAGAFLLADRSFNAAVSEYCRLMGVAEGMIENVTDGTNAFLVAIDSEGQLLSREATIVDARQQTRIEDIFLVDRPITEAECRSLERLDRVALEADLMRRRASIGPNERVLRQLGEADLIIYAPGTQHSSLFPSYLTPGVGQAIAANLHAIKLLITNLHTDAEITGKSAVEIVDRALYYLRGKGASETPTPCLITHYVINDPGASSEMPYVPLGRLDALEDPRLVRIANYEDGISGRHDASKILAPFIESRLPRNDAVRIAVLLYGAGTANKVAQSVLEMVRGGLADLRADVAVFHDAAVALDPGFISSLPFPVSRLTGPRDVLWHRLRDQGFEYAALFESSGMYRGEDLTALLALVGSPRLDALWGSRRLSVRDIEESYRMRYRRNVLLGALSYTGSHLLSVAYLALYGRYIADTLSGVRVARVRWLDAAQFDLGEKNANHRLLSTLLRAKAEIIEMPVQFLPLSPEQVKRTTIGDGLRALATIVRHRLMPTPIAPIPSTVRSDVRNAEL